MGLHFIQEQHQLEQAVPILMSRTRWGFDTETTGLDCHKDKVILIQIGDRDDQFVIDSRAVNPEPLRPFFESDDYYKYGHNLKFDYKMMKTSFGIDVERLRCSYLSEKVLTIGKKFKGFGLKDLMKIYLDKDMDKSQQKSFVGHTGAFSESQIQYAAADVADLIDLHRKINDLVFKDSLERTTFLECEAIPVFGDMEVHGLLLDKDKWQKIIDSNAQKAAETLEELNEYARKLDYPQDLFGNVNMNWGSPVQVVEFLQTMGVKVIDRDPETGKMFETLIDKSDDKTLKRARDVPVIKLLKKLRGLNVRLSTFGQAFLDALHPATGRIHPDFAQIGTETGRIASGDSPVNLLNIPARGEGAKEMRNSFIAPPDHVVETHDYSGCELRIWAHISQDPGLCKALREGIDLHCYVATKLYGKSVTKTENSALRTPAKSLNFGKPEGWAA